MKCVVIYFSQTGSTEKIAKAIHEGVKKAAGNCDILKIKDANPRRLYEYDLIGLGSPAFGPEPENVRNFINDMRFVGGKHIFSFFTHGLLPLGYFPSIYPKFADRGLVVIGMRDWYTNVWISHAAKPYLSDGHPDEIDLKESEEWGQEMVDHSRRISAGETSLIPAKPPKAFKDLEFPPFCPDPEFLEVFRTKIKYHKEKCKYPKCRLCMDNCPMDGIDLSMSPPVIAKPCIDCEYCTKICPTGAIENYEFYAWTTPPFYNHMRLYFLSLMKQAEAEGGYRRLVP
jgi:flavodoxin/NAD-dependent dihydropyrimidine dehydrogenase PreA subunit